MNQTRPAKIYGSCFTFALPLSPVIGLNASKSLAVKTRPLTFSFTLS